MAKIFASVGEAFGFAGNNTFKRPGIWLLVTLAAFLEVLFLPIMVLSLLGISGFSSIIEMLLGPALQGGLFGHIYDMIVALFNLGTVGLICVLVISAILYIIFGLFLYGLGMRILGGRDITFAGFFGTVGRGFQFFIINFIYSLVINLIFLVFFFASGFSLQNVSPNENLPLYIAFAALWIILELVFALILIPALVNFATQQKFGAAFHFREIGKMIGEAKWYKLILSFIVIGFITVLLIILSTIITIIIMLIPHVIGIILGLLFFALMLVFITFFETRFFYIFLASKEKPEAAKPKQQ